MPSPRFSGRRFSFRALDSVGLPAFTPGIDTKGFALPLLSFMYADRKVTPPIFPRMHKFLFAGFDPAVAFAPL